MGEYDDLIAAVQKPAAPAAPAVAQPAGEYDDLIAAAAAQKPAPPPVSGLREGIGRITAGLGDRLINTGKATGRYLFNAAEAVGRTGTQVLEHPTTLADPRARRELERGIDDAVTLGYGQKLADKGARALGTPENELLAATAADDARAYPGFRTTGNVGGMFLPGASRLIGTAGGKVAGAALGDAAATGIAARAAVGAARGVAGYEATAPVQAALSADAAGHRLASAAQAATDPTGLLLSGVGGAVASPIAQNLTENARGRATKDIGKDITAAEGPRARVTDQKRIAEVNDRLFEMTKENPELRKAWRMPADKALPEVARAKAAAAAPLDRLYSAVDENTGGIALGDIVGGFEARAAEAAKRPSGLDDAARLRKLADQFKASYGTDPSRRIPTTEFRSEVTNLHKTAESVMGSLEGTPRHEALSKLYDAGKSIIDQHLDASGLSKAELAVLRRANDRYFLLSRAEAAIESRGWKESNRPGFHLPHNAVAAVRTGSALPMVAYGATHPSAILPMAAAYGLGHAAPAIAARANWRLALTPPGTGTNIPEGIGQRLARALYASQHGLPPPDE